MEIRPIFSALLRSHKTAATLIVLKIALNCAILCNAVFLIAGRIEHLQRPSGLAEQEIVHVYMDIINPDQQDNPSALIQKDLADLRALPGVRVASTTTEPTFSDIGPLFSVKLVAEQTQPILYASVYAGGEQLLETLGVRLDAGRHFRPDEYVEWERPGEGLTTGIPAAVIITRAMADKLFPGLNPLGRSIYASGQLTRVVGIVARLVQVSETELNSADSYEYSMIFPVHQVDSIARRYLLRVRDRAQRTQVLQAAADVLRRNSLNRYVREQDTLEGRRDEYYGQDRDMAWLLAFICAALLITTAASIVGLTSLWVRQRTRQIGIRRALGATRMQILRYFLVENLLLTTLGIVLGMGLAYGLNSLLMAYYALPRLPLMYLPVGAVTLWLLGQLAVLGPALRAAAVPPAVATRIL